MLILVILALIPLGLALAFWQSQRLKVETYRVKPEGYNGPALRILFFSDFHLGLGKSQKRAAAFIQQMTEAEADIILFGGDLFTEPAKTDPATLASYYQILKKLKAKKAIYAIKGNHDACSPTVLSAYRQLCAKLKWQLLENELIYRDAEKLILIGLNDYIHEDSALYLQSEAHAEPGTFRICLIHEPDILPLTEPAKGPSLILSGHTHAGQIAFCSWQPVLPRHGKIFTRGFYRLPKLSKLPPKQNQARKLYGLEPKPVIELKAERYAYVSSGSGTTHLPLRWGAPQSFLLLELEA
ncbi:MAG: metallophosphoesterase [Eubacteriales bacterium]|nr:metallophosphoesterase [Eubacteriales bacterium]